MGVLPLFKKTAWKGCRVVSMALLFLASLASAVPAPPEFIVNDQTMECAQFNAGDECLSCEVPEGWESLGYGAAECPPGYTEVSPERNCTPFRVARCCSVGHSGGLGDCEDMVVNHALKQCMFVDGPVASGWESKPEGMDAWEWQCPEDYTWSEEGGLRTCPCVAVFLLAGIVITAGMARYRR